MNTKEFLLQKSFELFLQKSFKEVTMNDIITSSGLSKGAFYHYFDSKEQLFKEVVYTFIMNVQDDIYDLIKEDTLLGFFKKYATLVQATVSRLMPDNLRDDTQMHLNYYQLYFDANRLFEEFKVQTEKKFIQELRIWEFQVKKAQDNNEIKTDIEAMHIAKLIVFNIDGVGIRQVLNANLADLAEKLEENFINLYQLIKT